MRKSTSQSYKNDGFWEGFQYTMGSLFDYFCCWFASLAVCFTLGAQAQVDGSYASGPYKGPSVPGVDATTLTGKVMCGYQGWFGAAGDNTNGSDGWRHWCRQGPPSDGNVTVDLWPDVSELGPDERFATGFMLKGRPAEVFSSLKKATVLRHFQWMREYGIDGVFVQRFISGLSQNASELKRCNTVLTHCREGANRNGRTYAVMYDLSGLKRGRMSEVMNDWRALRKNLLITKDPAYLFHRGKPVVAVWGVGFSDGRDYTVEECRQLVEFLKNDPEAGGCTVMLGVPAHWRELKADAVADPALLEVVRMADIVSPWTVGRYTTPAEVSRYAQSLLKPDQAWCREKGIDYLPVVFPGFSWHNLKGGPINQIPRQRGQFLWSQFCEAKQAGVSMLYVAMFDEVDEATAIFKCANEVPVGTKSQFVTCEGLPGDYYLKLVNMGARLLRGETPLVAKPPVPQQ